jgi:hypothetical protein
MYVVKMDVEEKILIKHGAEQNAVVVNLQENPHELKDLVEWLRELSMS